MMDAGDPVTLATIAGTVVGTAIATIAAKMGIDRATKKRPAPDEQPAESLVSKAEARAMVDAAAAQAAKDAQVVATLKSLQSSIEAHEQRDTERFAAHERRSSEQHGALMGELARLHASHETTRTTVHALKNEVMAIQHEVPHLHDRISDTRRQAGLDTHPGVEVPRAPRRGR